MNAAKINNKSNLNFPLFLCSYVGIYKVSISFNLLLTSTLLLPHLKLIII